MCPPTAEPGRTALVYDAKGMLVERHDPGGGAWRYERTAAGRPVSVTDPAGAREEIRYGEHGHPTATVDPLGHVTTNEYDVFGNVVGVVEPGGAAWRYTYDALMRPTTTVDPAGGRWEREYDVNGKLVARVDPAGVRVTASVDAYGRVIGIEDGVTSERFQLDELGQVVTQRYADGTRLRAQYDLCRRRTLIEDATGAITRFEYTPGGRVAGRVYPSGATETFEYDACGRVAARVDGAGRRWQARYDADGEVVEVELPTGEIERFGRDEAGRITTASAPGAGVSEYVYDPIGRVVALTEREGGERRYAYDVAGNLVEATDANGATTRYAYDERGWPIEVVDPLGASVSGRYDAVGRIVEFCDQLGRASTCAYDPAGRLLELVDAGGRTRWAYDAAGRLQTFGTPDHPGVTIEYDARGRAVAVAEPGLPVNVLVWDAEDRLVERRRGALAMRWEYDADGRRAAIGYPDGTRTTYTHDAGGYVVAAHHPGLGSIAFERDAAGRLTAANAEGMRARWNYEHGDLVRYEMRAGGRSRTAHLIRDPIGRIVQATIDGAAHAFAYDGAGQLVCADTPDGAYSFTYDANGRLGRETSPSGVAEFEYDAAGQLCARVAADGPVTRYEYDGAGRRVHESGAGLDRTYRWDELGRLTEVLVNGSDGEDARSISVVVDALGELAALDGTPVLWDTAHPLAPLAWNGQGAIVGEGAPWALATADGARWLAPDWQATVGETPRDPWGAPRAPTADAAGVRLGFRGEIEFGADTWLRHRVYQPASRSFLQRDPLAPLPGSPAAANPYHYAANNAIALSDPLGLRPIGERELQGIRDRMDRGVLDSVVDASGEIALGLSIAAVFVPGGALVLGAGALAFSLVSAYKSAQDDDIVGVGLDLVGIVPGGGALAKGYKAGLAARAATRLRGKALDAASQSLRTRASTGLDALVGTQRDRAAARMSESATSAAKRDRLLEAAERMDRIGLGPGIVSFGRERAQELEARDIDVPLVRDPRPPLILPAR